MKSLIVLTLYLFAANAYAVRIDCTTKMTKGRTDKAPKVTWCGAVAENISDNGIKYRRIPKSCDKFTVEMFSIRKGDDAKFTTYCEKIAQKDCYLVRIYDNASRGGMNRLSSHIVFSSVKTMPTNFSLGASGLGHKQGLPPGPGTIVWLDLNCRVKQ